MKLLGKNGQLCVPKYFRFWMVIFTSSRTSRCVASSAVSPISTKPASALYLPFGKCGPRASKMRFSCLIKTMMAGAKLGNVDSWQFLHFFSLKSAITVNLCPHCPQNWCCWCQLFQAMACMMSLRSGRSQLLKNTLAGWLLNPAGGVELFSAANKKGPSGNIASISSGGGFSPS